MVFAMEITPSTINFSPTYRQPRATKFGIQAKLNPGVNIVHTLSILFLTGSYLITSNILVFLRYFTKKASKLVLFYQKVSKTSVILPTNLQN